MTHDWNNKERPHGPCCVSDRKFGFPSKKELVDGEWVLGVGWHLVSDQIRPAA